MASGYSPIGWTGRLSEGLCWYTSLISISCQSYICVSMSHQYTFSGMRLFMIVLTTNKKHDVGASFVCWRSKALTIPLTILICPLNSLCWGSGREVLCLACLFCSEVRRRSRGNLPYSYSSLEGMALPMNSQRVLDPAGEACYFDKIP